MDKNDIEAEPGAICQCGHGTYASSGVGLAVDNGNYIELDRAWIWTCLTCGARWLAVSTPGVKLVRYHMPSHRAGEVIAELRRKQWDEKFESRIEPRCQG